MIQHSTSLLNDVKHNYNNYTIAYKKHSNKLADNYKFMQLSIYDVCICNDTDALSLRK